VGVFYRVSGGFFITGMYSWLTPVAAVGLAVLMLCAAVFHLLQREQDELWFDRG